MKILSLFDGMACGALAFKRADVPIERYVAYEIDKYAIQVASHNFPMIEQRGDVFQADFTEFEGFDAVVGGSPCTYWSIAQKKDKRETEAHGIGWELFQQYARAIREAKPRFFIYENNKSMAQAIKDEISATFGFEPIMINSSLVSAQNRQRYYWVGIRNEDGTYRKADIEQPEDRGIMLKDVIEVAEPVAVDLQVVGRKRNADGEWERSYEARTDGKSLALTSVESRRMIAEPIPLNISKDGKSQCIRATCYKDGIRNMVGNNVDKRTCVAEPVAGRVVGRRINEDGHRDDYNMDIELQQRFEVNENPQKTNCITTVQKDNMIAEPIRVGALPRPNGELSKGQAMQIYSIEGKGKTQMANGGGMGGKTGLYAIPVNETKDGKAHTIKAQYASNSVANFVTNKGFDASGVAEPACVVPMRVKEATKKGYVDIEVGECVDMTQPNSKTRRGRAMVDKSNCLTTTHEMYQYIGPKGETIYEVKDGQITIKGKQYPIKLIDGLYTIRKLTVTECKRLQTVPEDYDMSVISNTQAYKCLGNGWTIEVIAHLITSVMDDVKE